MLRSIFFPRCCPMCGRYTGEKSKQGQLCDRCVDTLPRTEQAQIRQNETEMTLAGKTSDIVATMRVMHLDHAAAFLFFEKDHPVQSIIHKMKYADQPFIGYHLGRQAATEFLYTDFFEGIDLIAPVPLHKNRMRSRGYNQSEYIARGISDITGIPLDTTHVTREIDTPKQALQSGEDRKNNVAGAFAVNHPEQMYRKHILLVDDLVTTGETVRSCLKTMKRFRGARFSVFALCKAR